MRGDYEFHEVNALTYFPSNCVDVFPDGAFYTNLLINSLSCGTFVTEHLPQFYSQDDDDDEQNMLSQMSSGVGGWR